jgi:hypothetical protein
LNQIFILAKQKDSKIAFGSWSFLTAIPIL